MSQPSHSGHGVALANPATDSLPQASGNLGTLISRIEEAIVEETSAIRTDINFDIKTSNIRKGRFLYELTRALKAAGDASPSTGHLPALERLRETLAINASAVRAHLNAVSEIATLMQNAIQHAEADGTYSAGEFGWAK